MRRATFLQIAREGWPLIALTLVLAYVSVHFYVWWLGVLLLALAGYLVALFHDPSRIVPSEPLAVIVPVDGRVVHRRECYDPFLDREAIRVSIEVGRLGAYLLRSPVEGTVLELPASAWPDFRGAVSWVRTDEGDELILAVPEGAMFGARPCEARYGERVGQGRRCGPRRLARRLDVYLPPNARVEVAVDTRVRAGADVLATLVHKRNGNGEARDGAKA